MLEKYILVIKRETFTTSQKSLPDELLIDKSGDLSIYYAPFDHINTEAKLVICGITPGLQQALIALSEFKNQLNRGIEPAAARQAVKRVASFGGPMRSNLVRLLDYIGISQHLHISSCAELFGNKSNLVHCTSSLRYPVFKSLKNYCGSPSMVSSPFLRKQLEQFFLPELAQLSSRVFIVPLGPKVEEALDFAVNEGAICQAQVLSGLPHPSGANSERIAYFLGDKPAGKLSSSTNPLKIDLAKKELMEKVSSM